MSLYLYALAEPGFEIGGVAGVHGEPLELLPIGDIAAVAGRLTSPPPLDAETLAAQDRVVRELHARGAVLPMRFGSLAENAAGVDRALKSRAARAREQLAAVRGCAQMTVRVLGVAPNRVTAEPPASGREYLEARARAQAPPAALQALARRLHALVRDERLETSRHEGVLGTIYHLVERPRVDDYRSAVLREASELADLRARVSGPSPPYAFAEIGLP